MQPNEEGEAKVERRGSTLERITLYCLTFTVFLVCTFATVMLMTLLLTLIWKGHVDAGAHITLVVALFLLTVVSCYLGSCRKCGLRSRLWRLAMVGGPLCAIFGFIVFFLALYFTPEVKVLNTTFDASKPVLVVGTGPSGLSAAWMLAKSGRQVLLLEAESEIGGHSKTWVEPTDKGDFHMDIGFIFNNVHYYKYLNLTSYFGYETKNTALNTSGAFNGRYWDNVHSERGIYGEDLEREVDRFLELVEEPEDTLRYLTPLAAFLWWHGFSDDFYRLCLTSILQVLFVTKMGAARQSAQATLNYFRQGVGFSHMRYERPLVQNTPKGSQFLWRDVIADANSTGLLDIQLNSKVDRLEWRDGWDVVLSDGRTISGYDDVILAIPASESAKIVQNPWKKLVLGQVDYVTTFLTLHTDAESTVAKPHFKPAENSSVLYYVDDETMTGQIGRIFGDPTSDLLLTVHADQHAIDPAKVKTQYAWSHHFFSLWELAIARRFVPMFDTRDGIYFAGDWVKGVGHNDAIVAGVAAACKAGLSAELSADAPARRLYRNLMLDVCVEVAPLEPAEREP
ncbi:unnamed protein product [Effrenium voratum]|nr:unnamed protein product [Effrenium voratum]